MVKVFIRILLRAPFVCGRTAVDKWRLRCRADPVWFDNYRNAIVERRRGSATARRVSGVAANTPAERADYSNHRSINSAICSSGIDGGTDGNHRAAVSIISFATIVPSINPSRSRHRSDIFATSDSAAPSTISASGDDSRDSESRTASATSCDASGRKVTWLIKS